ncbi:MAG TPA: hypothetical protein VM754_11595 [Actinomycetota bacterium]|nr:hypothetical protein [Actinomycetota bacterium]
MVGNRNRGLAAVALVAFGGALLANPATQSFTLTVPSVLSITAPAGVSQAHSGQDANQAFAAQSWAVQQNQILGATATFAVATPFVHSTAPLVKRDCKLTLAIGTSEAPAGWSVTTANDQTNHALLDTVASVSATSTAAGNASFNLTVTFIDEDYSTLATGSYSTTVTGTVAANL